MKDSISLSPIKENNKLFNFILSEGNCFYYDLEPFTNKDLTFDDIKRFFKVAGKESSITKEIRLFFEYELDKKSDIDRTKHTLSVYLLGVYLYNHIPIIHESINRFIFKISNHHNKNYSSDKNDTILREDFLYMWFLIALYHDLGYFAEKIPTLKVYLNNYDSNKDKYDNLRNSISLFSRKMERIKSIFLSGKLQNYLYAHPSESLGIPNILYEVADEYFQYRISPYGGIDHGFAAAQILSQSMYNLHCQRRHFINKLSKRPTNGDNLIFSKTIFHTYIIPSVWAIMCHNIWFYKKTRPEDDLTRYLSKNSKSLMNNLIVDYDNNSYKSSISIQHHPLLFLLDFVDTIEPSKKLDKDLENIKISSENNTFSLSLGIPSEALQKLPDALWFIDKGNFITSLNNNTCTFNFLTE